MTCGVSAAGYYVMNSTGILAQKGDKLYLGTYYTDPRTYVDTKQIHVEKKDSLATDYTDYQYSINVLTSVGDVITTDYGAVIDDGAVLVQGGHYWTIVTKVDGYHVVPMAQTYPFFPTTGASTLMLPIYSGIVFAPIHGNNPGLSKKMIFIDFLLGATRDNTLRALFHSDNYSSASATDIGYAPIEGVLENSGNPIYLGSKANSSNAFDPVKIQNSRAYVPMNKVRSRNLFVSLYGNHALTRMELNGYIMNFQKGGTRMNAVASSHAQ